MDSEECIVLKREFLEAASSTGSHMHATQNVRLSVMQWNALADGIHDFFPRIEGKYLVWEHRKQIYLNEVYRYDPDVVCIEEINHFYDHVEPLLSKKGYSGLFKQKSKSACEYFGYEADGCALLYKKDRLELLDAFDFQLLDGLGQVGLCARFQVLGSEKEILVCTTHLKAKADEESENIRYNQAMTFLGRISSYLAEHRENTISVVICGDLNTEPSSRTHSLFKRQFESAYEVNGSEPSFTTWKFRDKEYKRTIDYIFHTPEIQVTRVLLPPAEVVIGENGLPCERYPSDHISLFAEFAI